MKIILKSIVHFLLFVLITFNIAFAQDLIYTKTTSNLIQITYLGGKFEINKNEMVTGEIRSFIDLENAFPDYSQYGAPQLHYITIQVLIPRGKTIDKILLHNNDHIEERKLTNKLSFNPPSTKGYDMNDPMQVQLYYANYKEDKKIYSNNSFYPLISYSYEEYNFRGYQIAKISFTPFQYNPVTKKIWYKRNIQFNVQYKNTAVGKSESLFRNLEEDKEIIRNLVINKEEMDSYFSLQPSKLKSLKSATPYYVIITTEDFEDDMEELRLYHSTDVDHQAAIIALDSIENSYTDPLLETYEKIEKFIVEELYPNGTSYILLVGDIEHIPEYNPDAIYTNYSDMHYSNFQIPVGRFSVDNATDIANCIAKSKEKVQDGTDRMQLLAGLDGSSVFSRANLFYPYMDVDSAEYPTSFIEQYTIMDSHTLTYAEGHGHYLIPQWASGYYTPTNSNIHPFGLNFGCDGAVFQEDEHPAEIYQRTEHGNAAYIGTVIPVTYNSFCMNFWKSYFQKGTVTTPYIGDMMMIGCLASSDYTLLGDPLYEIVSDQFQAIERIGYISNTYFMRDFNLGGGEDSIASVSLSVRSFNSCEWEFSNFVYSDTEIEDNISFSQLTGTSNKNVRISFIDPDLIPAGNYEITFDLIDVSNSYTLKNITLRVFITNENILSGDDLIIEGDTITITEGEYVLASNFEVTSGQTLFIEPGVILYTKAGFGDTNKIDIQEGATLIAKGTIEKPILFTYESNGVNIQISDALLNPLEAEFERCVFSKSITGIDKPNVSFNHCTFALIDIVNELFPNPLNGTMTNSVISSVDQGMPGKIGDLSELQISYSSIFAEYDDSIDYPKFLNGNTNIFGHDYINFMDYIPDFLSSCIDGASPESDPDPDGTPADIGAYYRDLTDRINVPGDYTTIQDAINDAIASGKPIFVGPGTYGENITIPELTNFDIKGIRIIGDSDNRPVIKVENDIGSLITFVGNAVFENFIFQHTGITNQGQVVKANDSSLDLGFKNCEFSACEQNSEIIKFNTGDAWATCSYYFWNVDFINNTNNNILLQLDMRPGIENSNWIKDCELSNNTGFENLIRYDVEETDMFGNGLIFNNNEADTLFNELSYSLAFDVDTNISIELRNCLFVENSGIFNKNNNCKLFIENCTFYNDTIDFVSSDSAEIEIHNSIFWNNDISFTENNSSEIKVNYTDINSTYPSGSNNMNSDPLFIDAGSGDFNVQYNSPTIDAGDPVSEFKYEPEPNGGRINMGYSGNTINASRINSAPEIDTILSKSVDENVLLEFTVTATDIDDDEISYSAEYLPTGADFDTTECIFSWTPDTSQSGIYNVMFNASDRKGGYDSIQVEIIVIDVPQTDTTSTEEDEDSLSPETLVNEITDSFVRIYSNDGIIYIDIESSEMEHQVEIFNYSGQLFHNQILKSSINSIIINRQGLFIVKVLREDGNRIIEKIIL